MSFYSTFLTLHIIFAGIWLVSLITDPILKIKIKKELENNSGSQMISLYLLFTNVLGIIGSMGILLTGIFLVSVSSGYGFFDMTANHWLATKQIIMVVILLLIFITVIPTAKKVRTNIENSIKENSTEDLKTNLKKLFKINATINGLVFLNFLFAITHRFLG